MATLTKEIGQSMNPTNGVLTIPGQYTNIGDFAFQNRQDITGLIIEEGVETIGTGAFERANNIASVQFPSSLKSIGDQSFYATALTSVELPEGLEYLSGLRNISGLTEITIPDSVTTIGSYGLMDNANLKTINWGEGITTIGTSALANTGLEELTIPNSVTQIGFLAVRKNNQLAQVSFEEGRTSPLSMGAWAFSENPQLTRMVIPDDTTYQTSTFADTYPNHNMAIEVVRYSDLPDPTEGDGDSDDVDDLNDGLGDATDGSGDATDGAGYAPDGSGDAADQAGDVTDGDLQPQSPDQNQPLTETDEAVITLDQRHTAIDDGSKDYLQLGYALKGNDLTGNPGGDANIPGVDSSGLTNVAVLGANTSDSNSYTLEISAESLKAGWNLESADIVFKYNSNIFKDITKEDITLASELPVKNAISIDDENGLIRFAAASLGDLDGSGSPIFDENVFASIKLDFDEGYFNSETSSPDENGKFAFDGNPLGFELSANSDETVFSRTFASDADGNEIAGGAYTNREIKSLGDLDGNTTFDTEDVNLYQAEIKFEEKGGGLTFGTNRVIGSSQDFTNLIRKGDTVTAQTTIENSGNSLAKNVSITSGSIDNASFASSRFLDADGNELIVDANNSVDLKGGVFKDDFSYDASTRESVKLEIGMDITGEAGSVVDVTEGLFKVSADGMGQNPGSTDTIFTSSSGSKNLITYQGDLNYDGRVSMKDLAFLNAGAARQVTNDDGSIDTASVARDVDADFSGKIDLADLSILDQDWGKSLHTGTSEDFTGSSETFNWDSLDTQGDATWDNSSFKAQNAIEADSGYVGSLEPPVATGTLGDESSNATAEPMTGGADVDDALLNG